MRLQRRSPPDAHRAEAAAVAAATPDLPSTGVDEHTQGLQAGADHQELADATQARAASLASEAYPRPVHTALPSRRVAGPPPTRTIYAPGGDWLWGVWSRTVRPLGRTRAAMAVDLRERHWRDEARGGVLVT